MTASSRNGARRMWIRWSEALLATAMLVLVPVVAAAPALADGWGCAPVDSPILHGTSTLACTPATQTISHRATATVILTTGVSITKFTWAASAAPAGRLALARAAGNETALAITGTPVTDVHVDETVTVNIKASVTEAVVGGKTKKLKPVTANLAGAVAVVHRT